MFIRNNIAGACVAGTLALAVYAQVPDVRGSMRVDFPKDTPVSVIAWDWGQSRPTMRGGAVILDLHASLSLRNSGQRRIRGVTLIVLAQEVTPGGKGSVSRASLDVAPGETFPVQIDLRLLRPVQGGDAMPVQVNLDGVLFDDLSFFGPNKLNSRRSMTVWELEAQRDRRYFKSLLERAGSEGLQKEILASMAHQPKPSEGGVQLVRGRSTNYEPEREMQFAFLQFPDSPIEPLDGTARITGNEARSPKLDIRNRSARSIKYLEIGWIVEDQQGREFLAGTVPAEVNLAPGQKSRMLPDAGLRFSERTGIKGMTGFVSNVEYGDGQFWIPTRAEISNERLKKVIAPSSEEQRLVQIYNRKGLKALVEELKKF